jgi:prepilin peptidase CpaA
MPDLRHLWPCAVLGAVLVTASVTDVWRGRVPNAVTYPAVAVALLGHALSGGPALTGSLIGLAVGFLPMLVFWLAGGVGGGDAKLMAAVGALAGWRFAVATMLYGFLAAALMAVAVLLRRRMLRRTVRRMARSVALLLAGGAKADPATPTSPKVPFALALCLGAAGALAEWALRGRAGGWLLGW